MRRNPDLPRRGSPAPESPTPGQDVGQPGDRAPRTNWWQRGTAAAALLAAIGVAFGVGSLSSHASKARPKARPAHKAVVVKPADPKPPDPPPDPPPPALPVNISRAASNAALELGGSGDGSEVRWIPDWGLWGNHDAPPGARVNWGSPYWWQSALDLRAVIRYLEVSHDSNPIYQQIIVQTFQHNVSRPGTPVPINFGNKFMDDTAWWGLAWVEAARYELNVRHDQALAGQFLKVAEWTASYIWSQPRPCHQAGIEWETGYPADTITNAEFIGLAGELAYFLKQPGPFQDTAAASTWTSRGWQILWWLRNVNLANIHSGHVYDSYNSACKIVGGSLVYTEGQMADALVQMGLATGQRVYYWEAQQFINYAFRPKSKMIWGGVLQQPCESQPQRCLDTPMLADSTVYKGLFVDTVADWAAATGSHKYDGFLRRQAQAVEENAASNGTQRTDCQTPHDCQVGFYWAHPIPPSATLPVSPGTQFSGLEALSDALAVWDAPRS